MKIKIHDKVKVISGKNKGKEGKVIQVFQETGKVVVEGVNLIKKNLKPRRQGEKGQIIELSGPLNSAKVSLLCPKCGRFVRAGYKLEAGIKKRICRKCKEFID